MPIYRKLLYVYMCDSSYASYQQQIIKKETNFVNVIKLWMITRAIEQPFVSCGAIELILVFDGAAINILINTNSTYNLCTRLCVFKNKKWCISHTHWYREALCFYNRNNNGAKFSAV
jgi:hypothetical protein